MTWIRKIALLAAICGCLAAAEPPNIVLIVSDDHGWGDFGFMGSGVVHTPHLDRLADTSAVFPNGYVPTALCRPSLATLLTGLYGHEHKITGNDPPPGVDRAVMHKYLAAAPSVPRLLGEAGYASLQTGKFWEGHYSNAGFTHGMTTEGRHGGPGLVIGRETMQPVYDFIAGHRGRPFFLWYAPMMPHTPHNPPERLLRKYTQEGRHEWVAKYYAMVEWFDETCGGLLAYIDAMGLRENTIVIFLVDNGWIQNTERQPHPTVPGRNVVFDPKSKASPYDGGLRTPIMIRWPGRTQAGRYLDLASAIDLAPTILEAAGLAKHPRMSGLSLLDVASGQAPSLEREALFGEIFLHDAVDLDVPAKNLFARWVRQGDWKLVMPAGGDPELYNVVRDPFEEQDRAGAEQEIVRRLLQLLDGWWDGKANPG